MRNTLPARKCCTHPRVTNKCIPRIAPICSSSCIPLMAFVDNKVSGAAGINHPRAQSSLERDRKIVSRRKSRCIASMAFVDNKAPGGDGINHPRAQSSLVMVHYDVLASSDDQKLFAPIEQALGPDGLGIIVIRGVPGYAEARQALLPLANAFANLSDEVKAKYEDPASHYSVGWSHGKETLADGRPDTYKGSYYANPLKDDQLRLSSDDAGQPWPHPALQGTPQLGPASPCASPTTDPSTQSSSEVAAARSEEEEVERLRREHPGYFRPNLWPREELPELEPAFKTLGRLICAVGYMLAVCCDRYVASKLGTPPGHVSDVLRRSRNPKARLLHYFAVSVKQAAAQQAAAAVELPGSEHEQSWCGWHTDHGSLTGLTSAMYLDEAGQVVPCPDPMAGLYIRDRHGDIVRAVIPPDCIAFQVGEALQVHSGGLLLATPHYVRAARGAAAAGVSRNTFAVFMQPNVDEPMDCPPGVDPGQVAVGKWQPGHTFGQFSEATFQQYYGGARTRTQAGR